MICPALLDGFYMSRLGIRMLIGQHVALHEPSQESYIGLICTKLSPVQVGCRPRHRMSFN